VSHLILTLDQNGQPNRWADWQDAVTYQAKGLVVWSLGETIQIVRGGMSRISGEQTIVELPSIIAIRNEKVPRYRVPVLNNKNLFRRDLNICAYCGNEFTDMKLTCDHIVPVSRWKKLGYSGNPDNWTNCVTACKKCNNYKGDSLLQDIGLELLYVPYTPDRFEAMVLRNRHIRFDQMDYIRPFLPAHSRAPLLLQ
jgi:5-methylcytosine-specific restriction endonuclease McrA